MPFHFTTQYTHTVPQISTTGWFQMSFSAPWMRTLYRGEKVVYELPSHHYGDTTPSFNETLWWSCPSRTSRQCDCFAIYYTFSQHPFIRCTIRLCQYQYLLFSDISLVIQPSFPKFWIKQNLMNDVYCRGESGYRHSLTSLPSTLPASGNISPYYFHPTPTPIPTPIPTPTDMDYPKWTELPWYILYN